MLTGVVETNVRSIIVHNVVADRVDSRLWKVDTTKAAEELVYKLLKAVPSGLSWYEVWQEGISVVSPSNGDLASVGIVCIGRISNINGCLNILVHRAGCVSPVITILGIVPRVIGRSIHRPSDVVLCTYSGGAESKYCGQDNNFGFSAALTYQH
jgi:hypothetical protein